MNQTWENGKKTNFGSDFGLFWPTFGPHKFFCVGFTSTKCYALLKAIIVCHFKED